MRHYFYRPGVLEKQDLVKILRRNLSRRQPKWNRIDKNMKNDSLPEVCVCGDGETSMGKIYYVYPTQCTVESKCRKLPSPANGIHHIVHNRV